MKELADAGADSLAGGLDGLYGDGVALPDFFNTGGGGLGDPLEATPSGGGGGGDGGGFGTLEDFGLGDGGQADGDSTTALLASLGLPAAGAAGEGAGAGTGALDGGGSVDQSEWALMQKQFEDMNKSFLQE